jgi:hypothetical protein
MAAEIARSEELAALNLPLEGKGRLEILLARGQTRNVLREIDRHQDGADLFPQMFDSPPSRTPDPGLDERRARASPHHPAQEQRRLVRDPAFLDRAADLRVARRSSRPPSNPCSTTIAAMVLPIPS